MSTQEERDAVQELREAGFSEEYIRDLRPEYDDLLDERDRLRSQRNELLALVKRMADSRPFSYVQWQELIADCHTAISKAERGPVRDGGGSE